MYLVLILAMVMMLISIIHLALLSIPENEIVHLDGNSGKLDIRGTFVIISAIPGLFALIFFTTINNFLGGVFMGPHGCVWPVAGFSANLGRAVGLSQLRIYRGWTSHRQMGAWQKSSASHVCCQYLHLGGMYFLYHPAFDHIAHCRNVHLSIGGAIHRSSGTYHHPKGGAAGSSGSCLRIRSKRGDGSFTADHIFHRSDRRTDLHPIYDNRSGGGVSLEAGLVPARIAASLSSSH